MGRRGSPSKSRRVAIKECVGKMISRFIHRLLLAPTLLCSLAASAGFAQTWTSAQLLNLPSETACKTARICAAKDGGFHAVYFNTKPWRVQYRRYKDGYLSPVTVLDNNFVANPDICEVGNGDVHIVWEDWDPDNYIGWARGTNGGQSWTSGRIGSWATAKFPLVAMLGPSDSAEVLMSVSRSSDKQLYSARFDGSSWIGPTGMGSYYDNEYMIEGICRSLHDGTVYRLYGTKVSDGVFRLQYRRYNGSYWESPVQVYQGPFFARQSIAVNPAGQVMVAYEQDQVVRTKLYTPGVGWSAEMPLESLSSYSALTSIPGSNDFYLAYTHDMKRLKGVRFSGGAWGTPELISVGLASAFTVGADVCAGPDGTLYACWEYWGSGDCQQWFSIKPAVPCTGGSGTISGVVRDQHGQGIPGATVGSGAFSTISGSGGAYSLTICAGTYSVSANKEFYTGQTVAGIQVFAGQTTYQDFTITANPPGPVTSFTALPSNGIVRLYWTNPASGNYRGTMIRASTSGYPATPSDGILVCDKANIPSSSDSYEHTGLTNGVTYYYSAFTHDDAAHYSVPVSVQAVPLAATCMYAKLLPNDTPIDLLGKVVSAVFPGDGVIYVQEPDRSSGIRVTTSQTGFSVGDIVDVSGTVTTRYPDGVNPAERQIAATAITKVGTGAVPKPLAMPAKSVGGEAIYPYVPGVRDGVGTNNIGLLVQIAGRVTYKVSSYIYVDDGSRILDISDRYGVMVRCPSSSIPVVVGDIVTVVGIVEGSIPSGWSTNRRFLHMRDWNDLVKYTPPGGQGVISGAVRDGSGQGISGATVSTSNGGYSTTTAGDGSYSLTVASGIYNVTASATGYLSQTVNNVSVSPGQTVTQNFTLYVQPGSISGYVRDSAGTAIPNASVSTNPGGYSTTSGTDGSYVLSGVAPGAYTVTASKTGYLSQSQNASVNAGQTTTLNFSLVSNMGTISGTVTNQSGAGIVGATVSTSTGGYSTTTGSGGSFTLSNIPAGTYSVTASAIGYSSQTQNNITVTAGQTTTVNFSLTPNTGAISGYVKDAYNNGIVGATVATSTGGYSTTTGAGGAYSLTNVVAGSYQVSASATGYGTQTLNASVSVGQTTTLNFTLSLVPVERVSNGTMEEGFFTTGWGTTCSGYTSKLPNPSGTWGWNNEPGVPFNTYDSTSVTYAGSHALGFAFCQTAPSPGKIGVASQSVYLGAPNASATFRVYAYHTDGNCPSVMCWNPGAGQADPMAAYSAGRYQWVCTDNWAQRNTWVTRTMTVTADSSGYVTIMVGGAAHPGTANSADLYIDNVSVM